jgi:hypothetical protein
MAIPNIEDVNLGGGGIHCITQQTPRGKVKRIISRNEAGTESPRPASFHEMASRRVRKIT